MVHYRDRHLSALATFYGVLTAGLAVGLQSVIHSTVGYFALLGKRNTDRGPSADSGVTGEVAEINWIQFQ